MSGDVLGSVWYETEVSGWQGVWTRIGNTNEFDTKFTHPSGQTIGGRLTMEVQGNIVRIHRWKSWHVGYLRVCRYILTRLSNGQRQLSLHRPEQSANTHLSLERSHFLG